jgi:hypothetical protein
MKALQTWWHWSGPDSPLGAVSAPLFMVQLFIAIGIFFPPIWWLAKIGFGQWWSYWGL